LVRASDNRYRQRFTVLLPGTDSGQQPEAVLIFAVNDDRFEAVLRQPFRGAHVVCAVLDMDLQFAQDVTENA